MLTSIDLQSIADAIREASANVSIAVGFSSLVWLAGQFWKWR